MRTLSDYSDWLATHDPSSIPKSHSITSIASNSTPSISTTSSSATIELPHPNTHPEPFSYTRQPLHNSTTLATAVTSTRPIPIDQNLNISNNSNPSTNREYPFTDQDQLNNPLFYNLNSAHLASSTSLSTDLPISSVDSNQSDFITAFASSSSSIPGG